MTEAASMLPEVDVIVDSAPSTGRFNMAMDAALFELGGERDRSVVRIYEWSEPTLTMGYFQSELPMRESAFPQLPAVRRLTGGGAILHDRELTYSCVVPSSHPVRQNPSMLYEIVHRAIILLLSRCGVSSCLRRESGTDSNLMAPRREKAPALPTEPFLCFLRSDPNDILDCSGVKIAGSAQRRRRGVTLQHGSILLEGSKFTPTLTGIAELNPGFNAAQFRDELPMTIARCLSGDCRLRGFSMRECEIAESIAMSLGD